MAKQVKPKITDLIKELLSVTSIRYHEGQDRLKRFQVLELTSYIKHLTNINRKLLKKGK